MQKLISFLRGSYDEFKRVRFPTREETIRLTAYVIGVSLATGLFVTAFDFLFKEGITKILG